MKSLKVFILLLTALCLSDMDLMSAQPRYQLIDLGLQEYTSAKAMSLNEKGWVAGLLSDKGYLTIFVLDEDKNIAIRHQYGVHKVVLNSNNEVFGSATFRVRNVNWEYDEDQGFRWANPHKYFQWFHFYHLGCPSGNYATAFIPNQNVVWDANDLGQLLVMNSFNENEAVNEFHDNQVWIYDNGSYIKLNNEQFHAGFNINNRSQVLGCYCTGSTLTDDRKEHLSIFDYNAKSVRLIDLPGEGIGHDLNDQEDVIGILYNPDFEFAVGFLATSEDEISMFPDFYPTRINNKGDIIGNFISDGYLTQTAIMLNGELFCLEDLSNLTDDNGNTWDSIQNVVDINDDGVILAHGKRNGKPYPILLKPISN